MVHFLYGKSGEGGGSGARQGAGGGETGKNEVGQQADAILFSFNFYLTAKYGK